MDAWQPQAIRILVVEDDPNDLELLRMAIDRNGVPAELVPAATGRAALSQLAAPPTPDIVLLDLRLPDTDGLVVLQELKRNRAWSRIPVIILSGSVDPADVEKGYANQASAYLQKPSTQEGWQRLVRSFTDYWLKMVLLPRP